MRILALLLLVIPSIVNASVGSITSITGPAAQIQRDKTKLLAKKGTSVEMNDAISTAKTKLGLTFQDNTKVEITEQSKLIIDDFVYDPNTSVGKLTMDVAMGTVRYASGSIAHNNRENVKLKTPTATISVRGTDFTMTVDEIGRSLVILLPTCSNPKDPRDCWVGEIEVATDAGFVILNQAYQATVATSSFQSPTTPKIINIDSVNIDNTLIISPPRDIAAAMKHEPTSIIVKTALDTELLEYKELSKNFLEDDALKFSELDINRLDINFLDNLLDLEALAFSADQLNVDSVLPTIHLYPWIPKVYNEESIFVYSERPPHIAMVTVGRNTDGEINLVQDSVTANLILNGGGSNVIFNITQIQ